MLCGLLNPVWSNQSDHRDFRGVRHDWGDNLAVWEHHRGELPKETIKLDIVMRRDTKAACRMTMTMPQHAFVPLKTIVSFQRNGYELDPMATAFQRANFGPLPMEVGWMSSEGMQGNGAKGGKSDNVTGNGVGSNNFKTGVGLRQGCSLSLMIFR